MGAWLQSGHDMQILEQERNPGQNGLIRPLMGGPLDIVGDVHGEIDALRDLLRHLGYGATGRHPEGRRLVFIGDLSDRGPDSPAVIALVSGLLAQGLAQCVLGNHELNLLRQERKEGNGWYFRDNHDQHDGKFLAAHPLPTGAESELQSFLASLPLALERPDLRLVHAAWHAPSIDQIRAWQSTTVALYDRHHQEALQLGEDTGLAEQARAELAVHRQQLHNPDASVPLLPAVAALDALYQVANPVRIVTSGLERMARKPFFASGKWRMVDRVDWWSQYDDPVPVVMGHYWRWPTRAARQAFSRGEPDLFADYRPHQWLGRRNNVFCVDFAVGARFKERAASPGAAFECRLAAVRWPEQTLVYDDGQVVAMDNPAPSKITR